MSSSALSQSAKKLADDEEQKRRQHKKETKREEQQGTLPLWLWLLKHSQAIVTTGLTLGIFYYHNSHVVYLTGTCLVTSFVAKVLKNIVKQPRPPGSVVETPGMPSTHSATGTYFSLYLANVVAQQSGSLTPAWLGVPYLAPLYIPTLVTFPILMMYSRIRLGVHTTAQCVAGAAIGCLSTAIFATLWYGSSSALLTHALPVLQTGLRQTDLVHQADTIAESVVSRAIDAVTGH